MKALNAAIVLKRAADPILLYDGYYGHGLGYYDHSGGYSYSKRDSDVDPNVDAGYGLGYSYGYYGKRAADPILLYGGYYGHGRGYYDHGLGYGKHEAKS